MLKSPTKAEEDELARIEGIVKEKSIEYLKCFDLRDYLFPQIAAEQIDKKGMAEDFNTFCSQESNVLVRTCIGKIWARDKGLSFDYDSSIFANYVFWITMFAGTQRKEAFWELLSRQSQYEYILGHENGALYRGDTMNSWSTTVNEFIRVCGNDYVLGHRGRYIPADYQEWYEFLSVPANYKRDLPGYITEFMNVVYTIGNILPVPCTPSSFNKRRSSAVKDYWDLTLLAIYNYYHLAPGKNNWILEYKEWLNIFGTGQNGWDRFVECTFMNPFVYKCGDHFGPPKPLWQEHFTKNRLPWTPEQFEQFFVNAKNGILERGELIAAALKKGRICPVSL